MLPAPFTALPNSVGRIQIAHSSNAPKHEYRPNDRQNQSAVQRSGKKPKPSKEDKYAAEQTDEQSVAASGVQSEYTAPRSATRAEFFPNAHRHDASQDKDKKQGCLPSPSHPREVQHRLYPPQGKSPGDVVPDKIDDDCPWNDSQRSRRCEQSQLITGSTGSSRHCCCDRLGGN